MTEKSKSNKQEAPMPASTDPRVQRTKAQIFAAFNDLLAEKEFSKITVTDLTKRAGISRKTFYLHYSSIDDLVDAFLRIELERIGKMLQSVPLDESGHIDVGSFLLMLGEEILLNFNEKSKILEYVSPERLMDRFKPYWADALKESNALGLSEELGPYLDIFIAYFGAGLLAVYHHTVSMDSELPLKTVAMLTSAAITGGITALTDKAAELKIANEAY